MNFKRRLKNFCARYDCLNEPPASFLSPIKLYNILKWDFNDSYMKRMLRNNYKKRPIITILVYILSQILTLLLWIIYLVTLPFAFLNEVSRII